MKPSRGINLAFEKTFESIILGWFTATLLVILGAYLFPGLEDYGSDIGLRLRMAVERYSHWPDVTTLLDTETTRDVAPYVFVDVDPERSTSETMDASVAPNAQVISSSAQACAALAAALSELYVLHDVGAKLDDTKTSLDCAAGRPINRYLLAEIVLALKDRGAKLIVLDVVLGNEAEMSLEKETDALKQALARPASGSEVVPVLFAQPIELTSAAASGSSAVIRMNPSEPFGSQFAAPVVGGVPNPAPGQPVRRYTKCYWYYDTQGAHPTASLPFLAAEFLAHGWPIAASCAAAPTAEPIENSPRIIYSLPSLQSHQDSGISSAEFKLWAYYHRVYNRCLAQYLWSAATSECGNSAIYRGAVVVIGASSPLRRDRHLTPVGEMAGAEVVINAIRSYVLFPKYSEETAVFWKWLNECGVVLLSGLVWLLYFIFKYACVLPSMNNKGLWARICARPILVLAFVTAALITVDSSIRPVLSPNGVPKSLDVFIPVLSMGLEQYVEVASWLTESLKNSGKWFLHKVVWVR